MKMKTETASPEIPRHLRQVRYFCAEESPQSNIPCSVCFWSCRPSTTAPSRRCSARLIRDTLYLHPNQLSRPSHISPSLPPRPQARQRSSRNPASSCLPFPLAMRPLSGAHRPPGMPSRRHPAQADCIHSHHKSSGSLPCLLFRSPSCDGVIVAEPLASVAALCAT